MTDINPQYVTLANLLQGRLFRIPQYQRAYSWQRKQREDLFSDIQRIHGEDEDRYHFMATIVGLRRQKQTIITTVHQVVDIVDGQQRLTTLIMLLKAVSEAFDASDKVQKKICSELNELLVKDDRATLLLLQTNHDSSDYFAEYLRGGTHPPKTSAKTIADREILSAMEECKQFVENWQSNNGNSLVELVPFQSDPVLC